MRRVMSTCKSREEGQEACPSSLLFEWKEERERARGRKLTKREREREKERERDWRGRGN